MSASGAPPPAGRGFNPSRRTRFTIDDVREFQELLRENPGIKWAIIAAGIGGAFEMLHDSWLFFVWLYWRLK